MNHKKLKIEQIKEAAKAVQEAMRRNHADADAYPVLYETILGEVDPEIALDAWKSILVEIDDGMASENSAEAAWDLWTATLALQRVKKSFMPTCALPPNAELLINALDFDPALVSWFETAEQLGVAFDEGTDSGELCLAAVDLWRHYEEAALLEGYGQFILENGDVDGMPSEWRAQFQSRLDELDQKLAQAEQWILDEGEALLMIPARRHLQALAQALDPKHEVVMPQLARPGQLLRVVLEELARGDGEWYGVGVGLMGFGEKKVAGKIKPFSYKFPVRISRPAMAAASEDNGLDECVALHFHSPDEKYKAFLFLPRHTREGGDSLRLGISAVENNGDASALAGMQVTVTIGGQEAQVALDAKTQGQLEFHQTIEGEQVISLAVNGVCWHFDKAKTF